MSEQNYIDDAGKMVEPVAFQCRYQNVYPDGSNTPWSEWRECTQAQYVEFRDVPNKGGRLTWEVRKLYLGYPSDAGVTQRLRRICKRLGLEEAIPRDDAELMGVLFTVLGMIDRKIANQKPPKTILRLADNDFDSLDLIGRALANSFRLAGRNKLLWVVAMDAFGIGSTVAQALCREYGFDPEDTVAKRAMRP